MSTRPHRTTRAADRRTAATDSVCVAEMVSLARPGAKRAQVSCGLAVHSGGTMWRLRSLVAMGHDAGRIAAALQVPTRLVQSVLAGRATSVSAQFHDRARQLWDAWWDKRPPERTLRDRRAAANARRRAEENDWCTPLGLDEDQLDQPWYRPYSRYRPATGSGEASPFHVVVPAAQYHPLPDGHGLPGKAHEWRSDMTAATEHLTDRLAYSVDEAALITGLSRDLLYDQMRRGKLAYLKVGRRRIITRQNLEDFLTRNPA